MSKRNRSHTQTHDKNNTTDDHTKNHPPHLTTIEGGAATNPYLEVSAAGLRVNLCTYPGGYCELTVLFKPQVASTLGYTETVSDLLGISGQPEGKTNVFNVKHSQYLTQAYLFVFRLGVNPNPNPNPSWFIGCWPALGDGILRCVWERGAAAVDDGIGPKQKQKQKKTVYDINAHHI